MVGDFLYPFLTCFQRKLNGQYPSQRFDDVKVRIRLHIVAGFILLYGGSILHVLNEEQGPAYCGKDGTLWRIVCYRIFASFGIIHALTTAGLLNQVMGERRITIPMYACAGLINLVNSLHLFIVPSLANALRLWGSINTFIFVRVGIVVLAFTRLDWNLLYTYTLISAAFIT